jgi:hypothetical protein
MEFLPPPQLFSQVGCGDVQLIVDTYMDPADVSCTLAGQDDCFRVAIPMFFTYNGPAPAPPSMVVCDLEILGEIIPSGTAPGVSIDYSLSANEDCEGDLRFDTNQSNNQFRYTFAEVGSGTLLFDDVFYLFVEARPEEMFSLDITSLSFELGASCNGGTCTESNVNIFGESSWTKAEGDACTVNDIDFTFGTEGLGSGSNTTLVPLDIEHNVSPGNLVLDDYDLEIVVVDDLGTLEDVTFLDESSPNAKFQVEEKTQTGNTYRFYLASSDVNETFLDGSNEMGDIVLHHPTATNMEGQASIYYNWVRVLDKTSTEECCGPDLLYTESSPKVVTISGDSPCSDFDFEVVYSFDNPVDEGICDNRTVYFDVFLYYSGSSVDLAQLLVDIEFEGTGDFTIVGIDTEDITCPDNDDFCPLLTNYTDCVEIDGDIARYGYCTIGDPFVIPSFPIGIQIEVEMDADACIESIKFVRSKIQVDGSPACAPTYTNLIQDFCLPSFSGDIETEVTTHVPNVDIDFYDPDATSSCYNKLDAISGCSSSAYDECILCPDASRIHITPSKDDGADCGLSTFDLVLITRHVLSLELLDSPYKLIAADANNSGSITTLDRAPVRQLVLQVESSFPDNTSWRFVDADFVFTDDTNPWLDDFPEYIEVDPTVGASQLDFVGIKIGDVNDSFNCEDCLVSDSPISNISMRLKAGEGSYNQGDTISVTFQTDSTYELAAFQAGFTYTRDSINYLRSICPAMTGFGQVTCSANPTQNELRILNYSSDGEDHTFTDSTTLFTLQFIAQQDIDSVAKFLSLDNSVLQSCGFDTAGVQYNMDLSYVDASRMRSTTVVSEPTPLRIGLYPNPAREQIFLQVDNFPGGDFELRVFDLQGKQHYHHAGARDPGVQGWDIESIAHWPAGIYLLQLLHDEGREVVKLVKE